MPPSSTSATASAASGGAGGFRSDSGTAAKAVPSHDAAFFGANGRSRMGGNSTSAAETTGPKTPNGFFSGRGRQRDLWSSQSMGDRRRIDLDPSLLEAEFAAAAASMAAEARSFESPPSTSRAESTSTTAMSGVRTLFESLSVVDASTKMMKDLTSAVSSRLANLSVSSPEDEVLVGMATDSSPSSPSATNDAATRYVERFRRADADVSTRDERRKKREGSELLNELAQRLRTTLDLGNRADDQFYQEIADSMIRCRIRTSPKAGDGREFFSSPSTPKDEGMEVTSEVHMESVMRDSAARATNKSRDNVRTGPGDETDLMSDPDLHLPDSSDDSDEGSQQGEEEKENNRDASAPSKQTTTQQTHLATNGGDDISTISGTTSQATATSTSLRGKGERTDLGTPPLSPFRRNGLSGKNMEQRHYSFSGRYGLPESPAGTPKHSPDRESATSRLHQSFDMDRMPSSMGSEESFQSASMRVSTILREFVSSGTAPPDPVDRGGRQNEPENGNDGAKKDDDDRSAASSHSSTTGSGIGTETMSRSSHRPPAVDTEIDPLSDPATSRSASGLNWIPTPKGAGTRPGVMTPHPPPPPSPVPPPSQSRSSSRGRGTREATTRTDKENQETGGVGMDTEPMQSQFEHAQTDEGPKDGKNDHTVGDADENKQVQTPDPLNESINTFFPPVPDTPTLGRFDESFHVQQDDVSNAEGPTDHFVDPAEDDSGTDAATTESAGGTPVADDVSARGKSPSRSRLYGLDKTYPTQEATSQATSAANTSVQRGRSTTVEGPPGARHPSLVPFDERSAATEEHGNDSSSAAPPKRGMPARTRSGEVPFDELHSGHSHSEQSAPKTPHDGRKGEGSFAKAPQTHAGKFRRKAPAFASPDGQPGDGGIPPAPPGRSSSTRPPTPTGSSSGTPFGTTEASKIFNSFVVDLTRKKKATANASTAGATNRRRSKSATARRIRPMAKQTAVDDSSPLINPSKSDEHANHFSTNVWQQTKGNRKQTETPPAPETPRGKDSAPQDEDVVMGDTDEAQIPVFNIGTGKGSKRGSPRATKGAKNMSNTRRRPGRSASLRVNGSRLFDEAGESPSETMERTPEQQRADEARRKVEARVAELRDEGRDFYKRGKYGESVRRYTSAIGVQTGNFAIFQPEDELLATLYANRAAALMMTGAFHAASADCKRALEKIPDVDTKAVSLPTDGGPVLMCKILCRLGRTSIKRGRFVDAEQACTVALTTANAALGRYGSRNGTQSDGEKALHQLVTEATLCMNDVKRSKEIMAGLKGSSGVSGGAPTQRKLVEELTTVNIALSNSPGDMELHEKKVNALASLKRWAELLGHCERLAASCVKLDDIFHSDLASLNPFPAVPPAKHLKSDFFEGSSESLVFKVLSPDAVCEAVLRLPLAIVPHYLRGLRLEERYTEALQACVTLLKFQEKSVSQPGNQLRSTDWIETEQFKLHKTMSTKDTGDTQFRNGEYEIAASSYASCLTIDFQSGTKSYVDPFGVPNGGGRLHAVLHCNRAACFMAVHKYHEAIKECTSALRIHNQYMKAILRRARCYARLKRHDEAISEYRRLIELVENARKSPELTEATITTACRFDLPSDMTGEDLAKAKRELTEVQRAVRGTEAESSAPKDPFRSSGSAGNRGNHPFGETFRSTSMGDDAYARRQQWYEEDSFRRWDSFSGKSPKKPSTSTGESKRPGNTKQQSTSSTGSSSSSSTSSDRFGGSARNGPSARGAFITRKANCHYETLQLKPDCSAAEIKKSYHKLALKYHPDKNKDSDAPDHFRRVQAAYEVLSDPKSRKKYDIDNLIITEKTSF